MSHIAEIVTNPAPAQDDTPAETLPTMRPLSPRGSLSKAPAGNRLEFWMEYLSTNFRGEFITALPESAKEAVCHALINFDVYGYRTSLRFHNAAVSLSIESVDFDVDTLRQFGNQGIKVYSTEISLHPLPGLKKRLQIAYIGFTEYQDTDAEYKGFAALSEAIAKTGATISNDDLTRITTAMNRRFLHSVPVDRLATIIADITQAETVDEAFVHLVEHADWRANKTESHHLALVWRNTQRSYFLYRLAILVRRHNMVMRNVNVAFLNPYGENPVFALSVNVSGADDKGADEVTDLAEFKRELSVLKFFRSFDAIANQLVETGLINGNFGNLIRAMISFIHQVLLDIDVNLYTYRSVAEAFVRHPELSVKLVAAFDAKFNPEHPDEAKSEQLCKELEGIIATLDTGHARNDIRRRNVMYQGVNLVRHILKTNFYCDSRLGISFRVDPKYLDHTPFDRRSKYPELPYGVFYVKGRHFFGFHIRFRDLARGGMRTIIARSEEHQEMERQNMFTECYNLAYTQQKKNKDIPEGGAKSILFIAPNYELNNEIEQLRAEQQASNINPATIAKNLKAFEERERADYLYSTQRAFITSLLQVINCNPDGTPVVPRIVDYWKRPEYLYMGPDENMHNSMIGWIAKKSRAVNYKPGGAFISGKSSVGFNHKEFGVTSLGVWVYTDYVLKHLGFKPTEEPFTIKISGGPDGDVAGNMILNLARFYPKTARLQVITDGSGTIYDPKGLDLPALVKLFHAGQAIKHYDTELLNDGAFLLDVWNKDETDPYATKVLMWKKEGGKVVKDWIPSSQAQVVYRTNAHRVVTDIFVPGGGRPRTLNIKTWREFLDEDGNPTAKAIVEGANLYLTAEARAELEKKGVMIIKDSSANKCGVITSSYEILSGLCLTDQQFLDHKQPLIEEVLEILKARAASEAELLLSEYAKTPGASMVAISDEISARINGFTDELLAHFETISLPSDPAHPLVSLFLDYCPKTLSTVFRKELLEEVPEGHKKAVIAASMAAKLVYSRGLAWRPTVVDILPLMLLDNSDYMKTLRTSGSE